MSGPKIDSLSLERERQLTLERKREARLRQIKEATNFLLDSKKACEKLRLEILQYGESLIAAVSDEEGMEYTIKRINELKEEALNELSVLSTNTIPVEATEICKLAEAINNKAKLIESRVKTSVDEELKKVKSFTLSMSDAKKLNDFSEKMNNVFLSPEKFVQDIQFAKQIIEESGIDTGNENDHNAIEDSKQQSDQEIKRGITYILDNVMYLYNSEDTLLEDKKFLMEEASQIFKATSLKDYSKLKMIAEEIKLSIPQIERNNSEFYELYKNYMALSIELNKQVSSQKSVTIKEKSKFYSIKELQEEVEKVANKIKEKDEQDFIRKQLDEVMELHGYDLCEDLVFDSLNENKGRHYIARSLRDDTALHVHTSGRQIMIEVVGTTSSSEIDSVISSSQLSKDDVNYLLEAQGQFCSMHSSIVKELRQRGIILNEKAYKQPDVQYCRIINLDTVNSRGSSKTQAETGVKKNTRLKEMEMQ